MFSSGARRFGSLSAGVRRVVLMLGVVRNPARWGIRALIVSALVLSALSIPSQATAASRIKACFYYNGYDWQGVSTAIEYRTVSGGWHRLPGNSLGHTGYNGCSTYNIYGRYRHWHLREVAFGLVSAGPDRIGFFLGTSRYYSRFGTTKDFLGDRALSFWSTYVGSGFDVDTNGWLNDLSGNGVPNCFSSPAMQIACWENQQGIHGDIVVIPKDSDGDHIYDDLDRHPQDMTQP